MTTKSKQILPIFVTMMLAAFVAKANPSYHPSFTVTDSIVVGVLVVLSSLAIEFAFVKWFTKFSVKTTIAAVIIMNLASAVVGSLLWLLFTEIRSLQTNVEYFVWLPSFIQLSIEGAVLYYLFKFTFNKMSFFLFALANTITLVSGVAMIIIAVSWVEFG